MEPESIRFWTCQTLRIREKLCNHASDGNIWVCSLFGSRELEIRMKSNIPVSHKIFGFCNRYVSPDYASTGMLNEGNDVYSFGVLLMEIITGRSPVDYSRPPGEVKNNSLFQH